MTNFVLQLQKAAKFFSYISLQLVGMKSRKKLCPQFLIMFLLFGTYWPYYISFSTGFKGVQTKIF